MTESTDDPVRPSSPTSGDAYAKPQPRPPRSPARSAQIRVQNRRREWLERHPEYVDSLEHELAGKPPLIYVALPDPLLYDALIRRFQTAEEREIEGRTKGYSRVLEVDLLRGEARLAQLAKRDPEQQLQEKNGAVVVDVPSASAADRDAFIREYAAGGGGDGKEGTPGPETREEGRRRWDEFLRRRFVLGRDEDFDYRPVDENDDYDALERREEEDRWFNDEEPGWVSEAVDAAAPGTNGRRLEGETGIQDF
ncbi:hypothetical protein DL767_007618 [Monosporascus sp. MG133]|nr:hypothetical protein DL767_007618 [Monosporascus sp. MG133]